MPVRYMGTKRFLAARVRSIVDDLKPVGPVVDLFSGMGSFAEALAPRWAVVTNDFLHFTSVFGRCRFLEGARTTREEIAGLVQDAYVSHVETLQLAYRAQLAAEQKAIEGKSAALRGYLKEAAHVGNSQWRKRAARESSKASTSKMKYRLATLYFSAGYFSLRQAIQLDALRLAIDNELSGADWDWAIAAWLASASSVVNSPGHTAQFLKPTSAGMTKRIQKSWSQDVWDTFESRLDKLKPVGTAAWRRRNRVSAQEALTFLKASEPDSLGAVYADPPYTSDHYSRYYHVYETLYQYDFPASTGEGRYRNQRAVTEFSIKTRVEQAFEELADSVADLSVPLVLSYPDNGLLIEAGGDLVGLLNQHFSDVEVVSIPREHSTMGASSGTSTKSATENLYVCAA